jgi:hypothetical protein
MKNQKNRLYWAGLILTITAALVLSSCMDVFATSWGSALKRDPNKLIPTVTASNVGDLLDASLGDTDFASTLLGKIDEAAKTAQGSDKTALQDAALKAAANASGLTTAILENAGTLLETGESDADITKTIDGILKDIDGESLRQIADNLRSVLDTSQGAYRQGTKASNEDLAVAAVILLLADAKEAGDLEDYLDSFASRKNLNPTSNEETALFLAGIIAQKNTDDEIISQLLSAMNLD